MIRHVKNLINFSYRLLTGSVTIEVPLEQQMSVYQTLDIEDGSELDVLGEVVVYE